MQTVTIDIINDKAFKLLNELEQLHLIRLHKDKPTPVDSKLKALKYKGAMSKQPVTDIEDQLNELRNGLE